MDRLLARPVIGEVTAQSASVLVRPVVSRLLAFEERDERARAAVAGAVEANRSRGGWRTFLIEQRALVRELPALVGQLGFVEARTVVVAGTRDRVVPFATAKALVDRLPRAELVTVPRGGHRLHRTHPEVVAEAVKRQLL